MALISSRFAGIVALEECAVDDNAHLLLGVRGPHVMLVQRALIDLGEAVGADGADGIYGSGTAEAVFRYKSKRSILNAQGQIDAIVGKKTIASLDAEIDAFDRGELGPPPTPTPPGVLQTVAFWINAFIPDRSLSEFVFSAPGASTGQSMIKAPWPTGDRFFLGDNRRYSDEIAAPSRIHSVALIVGLDKETPLLLSSSHTCGESIEIDSEGNVIGRATAQAERCRFVNLRGNTTVDPNGGVIEDDPSPRLVQLDYEAAEGLPLMPAPDIDMVGTLRIDRDNNRIRFLGKIDDFPAFEAYVSVNGGPPIALFQEPPIDPMELVGDVKRKVDGTVRFAPE